MTDGGDGDGSTGSPLVAWVRAELAARADPGRAAGQQRYMKSVMPFHGVGMPEVRRLVKRAVAAYSVASAPAMLEVARELWDGATHREERYAAMAVCRDRRHRSFQSIDCLPTYRHFILSGAWWDLVDETSHLVEAVLGADPPAVVPMLREWAVDEDMWIRRAAMLSQLGRGAATDVDLLRDTIEPNLADREFFIRKAAGWALRQYARTDPDWVRDFLDTHEMSGLTRREAAKHLTA